MNSIGNLVAMLNPLIVAYSVQWFGSWDLPLYVMGALFLVGAAFWMRGPVGVAPASSTRAMFG